MNANAIGIEVIYHTKVYKLLRLISQWRHYTLYDQSEHLTGDWLVFDDIYFTFIRANLYNIQTLILIYRP